MQPDHSGVITTNSLVHNNDNILHSAVHSEANNDSILHSAVHSEANNDIEYILNQLQNMEDMMETT